MMIDRLMEIPERPNTQDNRDYRSIPDSLAEMFTRQIFTASRGRQPESLALSDF